MRSRKVKIQIIGHGLSEFSEYLKQYGIYSESIISSCSPLAMAGKTEEDLFEYANDPKISMSTLLNIRKNLSAMLSREQKNFCDNYNTKPYGLEIREKNTTDYLIIMNSAAAYPLYERDGTVFSYAWTGEKFINQLKTDKRFNVRRFPFRGDFNWKYYFDQFIDTVMEEYDKNHIILIKLNSAQWFMNREEILPFDNTATEYRNAIEEIDNYFIKRTSCIVVNEHYSHIPHIALKNVFPYITFSKKTSEKFAIKVAQVIFSSESNNDNRNNILQAEILNRLAAVLIKKLTSGTLKSNEKNIHLILEKNLSFKVLEQNDFSKDNDFFKNIIKLKYFLDYSNICTLSNYVVMLLADKENITEKVNIEMLELYTRYFKLDINDIVAFYMIYRNFEDKALLKSTAKNILTNAECLPIVSAQKLCRDNVEFLREYPFLNDELKSKDESSKVYIPIENNCFIVFNLNEEEYLIKINYQNESNFDYKQIVNEDYYCPILLADALTYSYEYYAEKARRGDGAKPTYLKFEDTNDFFDSLKYIDYKALLENDNLVFAVGEINPQSKGFIPQIDFTELVDPNTALINVRNGLGDQICHFIMGEMISKYTNRSVIYFDLPHLKWIGQDNGSDFKKIVKHPVKVFSNMISPRLKSEYNPSNECAISLLNRINNYNLVVNNRYYNHPLIQSELKSTKSNGIFLCDDIVRFINTDLPYSYYFNLIRIEEMKSCFNYRLSDYIEFPPFEEQADIEMSEKMVSCDAVVMHIRRGDRAALGWNEDISFYPEAVEKIMALSEYPNKKIFVFSDDISWCKEHNSDIGLDLVENCDVYYVEGQHYGEECFRDVQLMALGKIIIFGNSGFSRIAAMYSDKWEMLFCADKKTEKLFYKYVRQNKYETTPFLKEDYSHRNASDTQFFHK